MMFAFTLLPIILSALVSPDENIVFKESFDYPDGSLPALWWTEGSAAMIKDGRLFVNADSDSLRVSTVWLDREFSGNIRIEFDAYVISSRDTANNINCFLFYSDTEGKALRESEGKRATAAYHQYHSLNGYIFTYVANGDPQRARVRLRFNPGFELLGEHFGYQCKAGTTYRIMITRKGKRFQYWVNGIKLVDATAAKAAQHQKGLFGFRTWHTCLWWDNLVVTQIR